MRLLLHILLTRPPPLFPYTTLFRSRRQVEAQDARAAADDQLQLRRFVELQAQGDAEALAQRPGDQARARGRPDQREGRQVDRKSTRLNSSHMSISYAVFCLKKKTI